MSCLMYKMKKIAIEDIVIWILIVTTLGIIIWKLFGSPSDLAITITVALFIIGMISTLTKKIYNIENKTAVSFEKVKSRIDNLENNMHNRFDNIENLISREK